MGRSIVETLFPFILRRSCLPDMINFLDEKNNRIKQTKRKPTLAKVKKGFSSVLSLILAVMMCFFLTSCQGNPTVEDEKTLKVNTHVNNCGTTDDSGNSIGTVDSALFGTGHVIDIPGPVGSNQAPGSVTVVDPNQEWLLSGVNPTKAAEPCASIFQAWRDNGGKWNDGLAAVGNIPIVAVSQAVLVRALGEEVFNNVLGGSAVGVFVEIYYDDGHKITILVGDTKNPSDSTAYVHQGEHWGHHLGDKASLIEPWQSQSDFQNGKVPGASEYHSDMSGTMTKWVVYENKVQDMDTVKLKVDGAGTTSGSSSGSMGALNNAGKKNTQDDKCNEDGTVNDKSAIGHGAEGAVAWAIKVANSRTVGYSQPNRSSVQNFNGKDMLDSDCTSFVWYAWMIGGGRAEMDTISPGWAPATGSFDDIYPKAGFEKHSYNLSELQAGDVLWNPGHAALYIGDGKIAESSIDELGGIGYGASPGDQMQKSVEGEEDNQSGEAHIRTIGEHDFQQYWRYKG